MAITGAFQGDRVGIYDGANLIACTTSDSFRSNANNIDASCKGSGVFGSVLPGTITWGFDTEGVWKFDESYNAQYLLEAHRNRTVLTLTYKSDDVAEFTISGDVYITSIELQTANDDAARFTATFEGAGAYTITT